MSRDHFGGRGKTSKGRFNVLNLPGLCSPPTGAMQKSPPCKSPGEVKNAFLLSSASQISVFYCIYKGHATQKSSGGLLCGMAFVITVIYKQTDSIWEAEESKKAFFTSPGLLCGGDFCVAPVGGRQSPWGYI